MSKDGKLCKALNQKGEPCGNRPTRGTDYCYHHPPEKENQHRDLWVKVLLPGIVAFIVVIVTAPITQHLAQEFERPDILVEGVLPIHLWEKQTIIDSTRSIVFIDHRLALIVKLKNRAPSPAIVHLASLEGCVSLTPFAADAMLPKDQRLPSGLQAYTWIEKYKKTIQAIRPSGLIREDSRVVPTFGAGYVGILFPFPTGGGSMISDPHSISLEGDCDAIPSPHPQPTVLQIFRRWAIHTGPPSDLAEEIRDGRVRLQLFIGNEVLPVESEVIRELQSIRWKNWRTLALAQMYEVPDSDYPPSALYR